MTWLLPAQGPGEMRQLAQELAFVLRPGDIVALDGELGAGKTTFARFVIAALAGDAHAEVPSPTFTLVQTYETPRFPVAHFDLYRLSDPRDLDELGLDDALARGIALIEWPDRAGTRLPESRLTMTLHDSGEPESGVRSVSLAGLGGWAERVRRLATMHDFLAGAAPDALVELRYLQGDASVRRYGRVLNGAQSSILMDWQRQPDGPPIRDGKPYSALAHLAEDVRPYVAVADALRAFGLKSPAILARDLAQGLLLIEDFGDRTFSSERSRPGGDQTENAMWRAAVDALIDLRRRPVPEALALPDRTAYRLPPYDRGALGIETELLLDWYWPALRGDMVLDDARRAFTGAWSAVFDRLLAMPSGWVLRDYHSPNLMWLEGNAGHGRVGILDFQDALIGPPAYDLVSLLQDARVDVPESLEAELFDRYCRAAAQEEGFDPAGFAYAYAALGAQRNTKILGIFARLARRDGKPQYLVHLPRIWRYLERDLAHPELAALRDWYDTHLPKTLRERDVLIKRAPAPVPL